MYNHNEVTTEVDKREMLSKLASYYGTHDLESMSLMIKRDLKDPKKMRALIGHIGFNDKDFFIYMSMMFFEIFNKMTIKKIRLNLNIDKDEDYNDSGTII